MSAMRPDHSRTGGRSDSLLVMQGGFSIISAIFLLVVLAALGGFMLTFSTVQSTTSALDLQGSRAYQAARAGIEWGTYQALRGGGIYCSSPPASSTLTFAADLAPFTVTVDCVRTAFTEGSTTTQFIYQLTSTATGGTAGTVTRVERKLDASVVNQQ